MKAAVYSQYGTPDVVQIKDVEKPVPKDNEVLIKVRAASVNPLDWHLMRGTPYLMRLMFGVRKPKVTRPGVDVSGEVEAVGRSVTEFKSGDAVFGSCRGAFAEYVCTTESSVVRKSDKVTFEQAASAPVAAYTALQGLRDKARIEAGQKVLVNGAAGGVGTYTVQIAKWFGADVTGVCSTRNVDMVRSIGADRVIDYTRDDFTKGAERYDVIFDLVATHSLRACSRVMSRNGVYIGAGALDYSSSSLVGRLIAAPVLSRLGGQKFTMVLAKASKADLQRTQQLIETRKLTPVIDRCYKLNEVAEAIRYLAQGHARGKVIILID
jgi:NADPH:quinone reductase-like Zn-dependent oxidoreductase